MTVTINSRETYVSHKGQKIEPNCSDCRTLLELTNGQADTIGRLQRTIDVLRRIVAAVEHGAAEGRNLYREASDEEAAAIEKACALALGGLRL